jgi:hypothetical protein
MKTTYRHFTEKSVTLVTLVTYERGEEWPGLRHVGSRCARM